MKSKFLKATSSADIIVDLHEDGTYTVVKERSEQPKFTPRNQRIFGVYPERLERELAERMAREVRVQRFSS